MSISEVYGRGGMRPLLTLLAAVSAFLLLQLLRLPLLMAARVLEVAQQRLDRLMVTGLPAGPVPAGDGGAGL